MSDKREIIEQILTILEENEGDTLTVEFEQQNIEHSRTEINNYIREEVFKCVFFFHSKNKLTFDQAKEVAERAVYKLQNEAVTSEYKIKTMVKDFMIHVISRDLKLLARLK